MKTLKKLLILGLALSSILSVNAGPQEKSPTHFRSLANRTPTSPELTETIATNILNEYLKTRNTRTAFDTLKKALNELTEAANQIEALQYKKGKITPSSTSQDARITEPTDSIYIYEQTKKKIEETEQRITKLANRLKDSSDYDDDIGGFSLFSNL